ncbi:MAG TPA: hypothetical protein VFD88_13995 [Clostridia bacterium]|nr:hypothetical protein [Clostridia bacterium]
MTPEERDLRRALNARSGEPSPEFQARLASTLVAEGKPASRLLPALALVASVALVFGTVGVLLLARQARNEPPPVAATTSTPTPSTEPTPTPGSTTVAGVITKPRLPIPLPTEVQASAPSTNVLWAFMENQYLYRSMDRGATWEQRPLPPTKILFGEISFVSNEDGWLTTVAMTGGLAACGNALDAVWHTTDAGATWQSLGSSDLPQTHCYSGLSFVDSNRGFLDAMTPSQTTVIYRTTDGGLSWTASTPISNPSGVKSQYAPGLVRAFGSTLLVPINGQLSSGNGVQDVYLSTDGGASWSYLAGTRGYGTIALVTATRWIQLMPPGSGRETTDAGASWHPYPTNYSQAAPIGPQVVFADARVGYATVRGAIARTLDGGLHWDWNAVKSPGT